MLWSSVPELRAHVARQLLLSWLAIAGMAALFLLQPAIVRHVHGVLLGSGFASGSYEDSVLAQYYTYGWWSLLVAWGSLELSGLMLVWRYKARPGQYPRFQERLRSLAQVAGVTPPTLIVLRGAGRLLNAAATQSLLSGPKVVIMGDIVETLTDLEADYVIAHELSHIKHHDVVAGVVIGAGNTAISIQKWAILLLAAYDVIMFGWRALIYLGSTWVVLSITHQGYKLLAATNSRSREYLADVGAIKIVGWDNRVALILGLARIHHALTRWRPFRIFRRAGTVFSTHPDIDDRARALGFDTQVLADGNVRVGDIVIKS